MSSSVNTTSSPLQRASDRFRPMLKPKNPLRRHQRVCTSESPASPTSSIMSNVSPSTSSSLSDHVGGFRSSASAGSLSSEASSAGQSAAAAQVHIGEYQVSLPLLALTGVSVFVGALVMRALYTFGTSLLRLFVLIVFVVAVLTLTRFNEKQQEAAVQQQERQQLKQQDFPSTDGLRSFQGHSAAAYARGYGTEYGVSGYASPSGSPLPSSSPSFPFDGRSRQLLAAHQRYPSYK